MDRATEIAHRVLPAAGSEWPLSEIGRGIAVQHAANVIRNELISAIDVSVKIKQLPNGQGLPLPSKAHASDAGIDLRAAEDFVLYPGQAMLVPTGFAIELPDGFEAQVRPRSGLAVKHSITVLNSPGTIDSGYRGEVKVLMINHGLDLVTFFRGDRIAQMVVQRVLHVVMEPVVELGETERGTGGFGSSGTK